jgi:hypothetical protein
VYRGVTNQNVANSCGYNFVLFDSVDFGYFRIARIVNPRLKILHLAPFASRRIMPKPSKFAAALRDAEKQLATTYKVRDKAMADLAAANLEIPRLQRIVAALGGAAHAPSALGAPTAPGGPPVIVEVDSSMGSVIGEIEPKPPTPEDVANLIAAQFPDD